ncbi:MAG: inositol monophosphatase family protein [Roseovarius sp.]
MDANEIRQVAQAVAGAARLATLPYFRTATLGTGNKNTDGSYDPVTLADHAAEKAMRSVLADLRPDDAIIGEEYGAQPGRSGLTWVLDPIDGTRAFMSGAPTWGVLIAVSDETGPIYGIIDQPYIGERFEGGFGRAEMVGPLGTAPLCVRGNRPLSDAILFSTFPEVGTPAEGRGFSEVARCVKLTRYGLDCYAYAMLALGQIDLVIEAGLHAYDIGAPIAVIEAAGGIVTDWQGQPAQGGGRVLAAAGGEQHQAALEILSRIP